jgi:hypothetical protein
MCDMVRKFLWLAVGLLGLFLLMGLLVFYRFVRRLPVPSVSDLIDGAGQVLDGAGQVLLPGEEPSKREIVQESLLELSRAIRKEADAVERNHLKTG